MELEARRNSMAMQQRGHTAKVKVKDVRRSEEKKVDDKEHKNRSPEEVRKILQIAPEGASRKILLIRN